MAESFGTGTAYVLFEGVIAVPITCVITAVVTVKPAQGHAEWSSANHTPYPKR